MKTAAMILGAAALLGTIVPPLLFLNGSLAEDAMKLGMFVSSVAWFMTAPWWLKVS